MPKERHHLLLAQRALQHLDSDGRTPIHDETSRFAYLLGSTSPDIFFYDLPSFGLSRVGSSLHRYQGEAGVAFFRDWLEEEADRIPPEIQAWMLGFVSHLMADALMHPLIEAFSRGRSIPCGRYGLSPSHCHFWLESELEAFWLSVSGPGDGYLPLLRRIRREPKISGRYVHWMKRFLERTGVEASPTLTRIRRCQVLQAFLLHAFSHPALARRKERLLNMRGTHMLGALIVPAGSPRLPLLLEGGPAERLCQNAFMEEVLMRVGKCLTELPVRT